MINGLLLAPGAGAGRDQPNLVAVDRVASALGLAVGRHITEWLAKQT
ncbi:MAG: hypothetical protein ACRD0E_11405 [Acidimicrobiales bacterium]